MTHSAQFRRPLPGRQRGAVLAVAMMFLVVITLLGITAISSTTLEEKMAANARDYNTALQAAEAALRDAELDIKGTASAATARNITNDTFTAAGTNGLWLVLTAATQTADSVNWTQSVASGSGCAAAVKTVVPYGCYTGATALTGVNQLPRYVIELSAAYPKARVSGQSSQTDYYYVRITARGWGTNPNTQVTLQSIFLAPI